MFAEHTRLLIVDSDAEETRRIERALTCAQGAVEAVWGLYEISSAATLAEALPMLRLLSFDAALLSLRLADSEGVATLIKVLAAAPHLPVVVLADEDEQAAMALIHEGAQDYLLRSERSARLLTRTLRASIQRKRAQREVTESRLGVIWRLAKAAEYRDEETGNHVVRVGCYSKLIAEALRLEPTFVERVFLTAPLHDIGKIGIPDSILLKPGPLTDKEWSIMRQHCQIGAEILHDDAKSMAIYRSWHGLPSELHDSDPMREMACGIALTHHERWDGSGYPAGLAGARIPLEGRIVAISDVFDALVSERPYKPAYSEEKALSILREGIGQHFDPDVFAAFESAFSDIRRVRQRFADQTPAINA